MRPSATARGRLRVTALSRCEARTRRATAAGVDSPPQCERCRAARVKKMLAPAPRTALTGRSIMPRVVGVAVLLTLAATPAAAQEFRGSIVGHVKDTSDLALPGVTVTATNVATNVASTTVSNNEGNYTVAYLIPGNYRLTAELSGFKKFVRERLEVRVGDRLTLDLTMAVGSLEETVTVTAQSPLLETGSASAGQVIDEKRIALMPLSDGNPFVLARLVPGVAYTGDLKFSRPFDNAGTSSITADGSSGGNEFTLDGSPNMANGRRVAYVPRRDGERDAQERHESVQRRQLLLQAVRQALGDRFLREQGRRHETVAQIRSSGRQPRRTNRSQPHLLFRRGRMVVRPVPRAGTSHRAHAGRAQRRLLGVVVAGAHHLRPDDGAARQRTRRPHAVRRKRRSCRSHQSGRGGGAE
ncbi:MAG: hypothetical protein DMG01_15770, partial [Acidobacteria bacterium]